MRRYTQGPAITRKSDQPIRLSTRLHIMPRIIRIMTMSLVLSYMEAVEFIIASKQFWEAEDTVCDLIRILMICIISYEI